MKKKGFTLIELLAVIVILALIALIAVPIILNMIEKSRKQAAIDSAYGYVEAIEYNNGLSEVSEGYTKTEIGENIPVSQIDVKMKGKKPSKGLLTIDDKGMVETGQFCFNNYLVTYVNRKAEVASSCPNAIDATSPILTIKSVNQTTNKLEIEYNVEEEESEIVETECKAVSIETTPEEKVGTISNKKCTITGLKSNVSYVYIVKVKNEAGLYSNVLSDTVSTNGLGTLTRSYNTDITKYTSKRIITLSGNTSGTKIEYALIDKDDVVEESDFTEYTTPVEITSNGKTLYARINDREGNTTEATTYTEEKIDTEDPQVTLGTITTTKNSITINYTATDSQSGLGAKHCYYKLSTDSNWSSKEGGDSSCTITGLTSNKEYSLQVFVYDNAERHNSSSVVTAKTKEEATAIFNTQGGTSVSNITKVVGEALGTLPTTTKSGYTFDGWYTAASGGTKITSSTTMPSGGATYYAHWTYKPSIITESGATHKGIVYMDPSNLQRVCNASNSVSTTGTKTGCMKFYIYDDSGDNYKMILDHNTTTSTSYDTSGTYKEYSQASIRTVVNSDTSSWTGFSGGSIGIITANEIATITNTSTFNGGFGTWFYFDGTGTYKQTEPANFTTTSRYAWLFDYTEGCTSYGCKIADSSTMGYWTSSPISDYSDRAWLVDSSDALGTRYVDCDIRNNYHFGVRPVITIPKSYIAS